MAPFHPKIALVGAGPASLTLGAILTHNNIPFTIYEASTTLRDEGGSLDIHPGTGQAALKEAGLWPQFVKHARPDADVAKVIELKTGEVFWDENGPDKQEVGASEDDQFAGRPEIDRGDLLKITHEGVAEGAVKWGKKLERVVPSATQQPNKHDLHFADGTQETDFDLVVGGDGAWSKVRRLVTDIQPHYSGITLVEFWNKDLRSNDWLLDYVGAGMVMAFGEGAAVMSIRIGDGSLRAYGCLRVPEDFSSTCGIDWNDKDVSREAFVERYLDHVHPDLQRLLLECKDSTTARPLYELPVPFTFEHRKGVTLIGDAAHLMTPFAGVGVNVSMTDSLGVGRAIIAASKGEKDLDEAIEAHEKDMFVYMRENMEKSLSGKENHFAEHGSKEMADRMRDGHAAARAAAETQGKTLQGKAFKLSARKE
ncbi:monooxygenase [Massarina eburnea CBS 473.64]|uniref:Monooxygenase n=1 Tax=Massarina eburnea CBS 473.64 TaxID=1395130 RepID=A0A6A6RJ81_9PLEO|nr:monooxygenase [Massarina eburnea CBS 473.64]